MKVRENFAFGVGPLVRRWGDKELAIVSAYRDAAMVGVVIVGLRNHLWRPSVVVTEEFAFVSPEDAQLLSQLRIAVGQYVESQHPSLLYEVTREVTWRV
jgi:hypothetical protein